MLKEYKTVVKIYGPLMLVEGVEQAKYGHIVDIELGDGSFRHGQILQVENDKVLVLMPDEPKFYAREKMRSRVEGYAAVVVPVVLLVCVMWIGALSYMNVRQRRGEIGLLRAVGVGSGPIAVLFLSKAVLVGLAGAVLGFAAGTAAARHFGPPVFEVAAAKIGPLWACLGWSLAAAPILAVLASALPAMIAVSMDPAEALREE